MTRSKLVADIITEDTVETKLGVYFHTLKRFANPSWRKESVCPQIVYLDIPKHAHTGKKVIVLEVNNVHSAIDIL